MSSFHRSAQVLTLLLLALTAGAATPDDSTSKLRIALQGLSSLDNTTLNALNPAQSEIVQAARSDRESFQLVPVIQPHHVRFDVEQTKNPDTDAAEWYLNIKSDWGDVAHTVPRASGIASIVLVELQRLNLILNLHNFQRNDVNISFEIIGNDKNVYKVGDAIELCYSSAAKGVVYLIHISEVGKISVLYPTEPGTTHWVEADEPECLLVDVTKPYGAEYVKLIWADHKLDLDYLYDTAGSTESAEPTEESGQVDQSATDEEYKAIVQRVRKIRTRGNAEGIKIATSDVHFTVIRDHAIRSR